MKNTASTTVRNPRRKPPAPSASVPSAAVAAATCDGPQYPETVKVRLSSLNNLRRAVNHEQIKHPTGERQVFGKIVSDQMDAYSIPILKEAGLLVES